MSELIEATEERPRGEPSPAPLYMTRKDVVAYAQKLGIPLKYSKLARMAMYGNGPKPDSYYGTTELFTLETAHNWLMSKVCTDKPNKSGAA